MTDAVEDCKACRLHKNRKHIVRGRGVKPAFVMFVGEAPGHSENVRGMAFVGKSGNILNHGINLATTMIGESRPPSYYITNVVCCVPIDEEGDGKELREPLEDEVWACREKLEETYLEVKPSRIVFLGDVAFRNCKKMFPAGVKLFHPAYVGRKGGIESPEFRRFARDLSKVFKAIKIQEEGG